MHQTSDASRKRKSPQRWQCHSAVHGFIFLLALLGGDLGRSEEASPVPLPHDEAAWLHATCIGTGVGGEAQPSLPTSISPCVLPNGLNKIEWWHFLLAQKQVSCRHGLDACPNNLSRSDALVRVNEEFLCKNGQKNGVYKASVKNRFLNPGLFDSRVEANYAKGKLTGESRHFASGKFPCRTHHYKNGLLDGKSTAWTNRVPPRPMSEVSFKNGLREGDTLIYNNEGEIRSTIRYERGVAVHEVSKASDGTVLVMDRAQLAAAQQKDREATARQQARQEQISRGNPGVSDNKAPLTLVPLLGVGGGYMNDAREPSSKDNGGARVTGGITNAQLYLGLMRCRDAGCAGWLLTGGKSRSLQNAEPVTYGEMGLGFWAMYAQGYMGLGARQDLGRHGVQATIMGGLFFTNIYVRGYHYTQGGGTGVETGVQLTLPLGRF